MDQKIKTLNELECGDIIKLNFSPTRGRAQRDHQLQGRAPVHRHASRRGEEQRDPACGPVEIGRASCRERV